MFMTLNEMWEVSDNVVTAVEMDWIFFTFGVTTPANYVWFHVLSILKCFLVFMTLNEVWDESDNVVTPLCPLCLMHDHTSHLFECKSLPTSLSSLDLWTNPDKVEPFLATWGERLLAAT